MVSTYASLCRSSTYNFLWQLKIFLRATLYFPSPVRYIQINSVHVHWESAGLFQTIPTRRPMLSLFVTTLVINHHLFPCLQFFSPIFSVIIIVLFWFNSFIDIEFILLQYVIISRRKIFFYNNEADKSSALPNMILDIR